MDIYIYKCIHIYICFLDICFLWHVSSCWICAFVFWQIHGQPLHRSERAIARILCFPAGTSSAGGSAVLQPSIRLEAPTTRIRLPTLGGNPSESSDSLCLKFFWGGRFVVFYFLSSSDGVVGGLPFNPPKVSLFFSFKQGSEDSPVWCWALPGFKG